MYIFRHFLKKLNSVNYGMQNYPLSDPPKMFAL